MTEQARESDDGGCGASERRDDRGASVAADCPVERAGRRLGRTTGSGAGRACDPPAAAATPEPTAAARAAYSAARTAVAAQATVADCRAAVMERLPPPEQPLRRNRAITSMYAAACLAHPALMKWAGMAAFASHHARLLMVPLRMLADREGRVRLQPRGRLAALVLRDVHLIRRINAGIFEDIFWAHLVYDGTADGLVRLERLAADEPGLGPMVDGFRRIEAGRRTSAAGDARAGAELVWQGNVRLLRHEQETVVQPSFEDFTCGFARAMSIGSSLDFEARGLCERLAFFTSFYWHMLVTRRGRVGTRRAWPRIDRLEHRWTWIEERIVPGFRRFESGEGRIRAKLAELLVPLDGEVDEPLPVRPATGSGSGSEAAAAIPEDGAPGAVGAGWASPPDAAGGVTPSSP